MSYRINEELLKKIFGAVIILLGMLLFYKLMIDLPDFFNNPSLISFGAFKIQYYSLTWIISALLIYFFLKNHRIIIDLGLNQKIVSDMVIIYGLFFGAMIGGRLGYMFFYDLQRWIEDPFRLFFSYGKEVLVFMEV